MKKNQKIIDLRFKNHIAEISAKRLKTLMPIATAVLLFLIISDIRIRHNIYAVYTRLLPLSLAVFLYVYNKIKPKGSISKVILYNIFLASIPAMMFAKYLIHYEEGNNYTSIIGIITAIFIISLEVRANTLNSVLIYLIPPVIFTIILIYFYSLSFEDWQSLINILVALVVGFFINSVQNNFRFKTYRANTLLNIEKKKLEESNEALNQYKSKLEDMVEKKTLSLKYALGKAKESDALKTQFLLNISHELRTPMNAVLGFNEIISRKNPAMKKEYEIIENSLNTLLRTIEDIILLSKLQSDQAGLELSKFSVNPLNEKIFDRLKTQITENKKAISVEFDNQLKNDLFLYSDKQKIEIILNQITDNAVKYTEQGKIKMTCKLSENKLLYSIADTGIGISPNELPHIFDPFRKIEKTDKLYSGTGIGLSIVKKLITLLKGEISVKSNQDKGTTVILRIPLSV